MSEHDVPVHLFPEGWIPLAIHGGRCFLAETHSVIEYEIEEDDVVAGMGVWNGTSQVWAKPAQGSPYEIRPGVKYAASISPDLTRFMVLALEAAERDKRS